MSPRTIKQFLFVCLLAGLALAGLVALPAGAAPPVLLVWGLPGAGDGEFNNPSGLAVTGDGKTIYVADSYNHRIQKFTMDGVTATFAASWGTTGITGTADGEFDTPAAVAVDGGGTVYVADTNNHRIQVNSGSGFVTRWGTGSPGADPKDFNSPGGVAVSGTIVYVADSKNNRIKAYDAPSGDLLYLWGVAGSGDGEFNNPIGVATDGADTLYVADSDNNRIQKFAVDGVTATFVSSWGTGGTLLGQFTRPTGVAVDASNNVYVVDSGNNRVQVFDDLGAYQTTWGTYGTDQGQFILVSGIAVDNAGNTYVTDTGNNRIQEFGPLASTPPALPTPSALTFVGEWGPYDSGTVITPTDIALDSAGNVYAVDSSNNRVVEFDGDGKYIRWWDGSATSDGQFINPSGIAISGTRVYVADRGRDLVRVFDPPGTQVAAWTSMYPPVAVAVGNSDTVYVTYAAISGISIFDSDGNYIGQWGGLHTTINDIAVNTAGEVFVSDAWTSDPRVKQFTASGGSLAEFGSSGMGNGQFFTPAGLAIDRGGNIYVADSGNTDHHGRIQQFGSDNGYLFTLDDSALAGHTTPATFNHPGGVAVTRDGSAVYVADTGNNRILKFALAAPPDYVRSFGEYGSGDGQFNKPGGIAVDNPLSVMSAGQVGAQSTSYVYVADTLNRRVQKFTTGGTFKWQWSMWYPNYPNPSDQFVAPASVAYSPKNKWVYVTDAALNRVDAFDPSVEQLLTPDFWKREWGGPGSGNNELWHPIGVAVDKDGLVYVADAGNDRIVKYNSLGIYQAKYGPYLDSTWCPGLSLKRPSGVAVDSTFLYISDTGHNRIVKVRIATGVCVNYWGTMGHGSCPSRQFDAPSGLTVGGGFLTIADTANDRLMKYTTDGLCIGKVGSSGSSPGQFNKVTGVTYDGFGNIFASDTNNNMVKVFEGVWLIWTPVILKNH
jgi:DNA-binding beta-propeller fold protein YncE